MAVEPTSAVPVAPLATFWNGSERLKVMLMPLNWQALTPDIALRLTVFEVELQIHFPELVPRMVVSPEVVLHVLELVRTYCRDTLTDVLSLPIEKVAIF